MPLIFPPVQYLIAETPSAIAAGQTRYLGPGGATTSGGWIMPRAAVVTEWRVTCDTAPGGGETFTCTLFINGGSTASTATISGASDFDSGIEYPDLAAALGQSITIQCIASGSAASALFRYYAVVRF